jgi:hypothetical protein
MDTSTPIMIQGFTGGPDGADLEECYFQETAPGSGEFYLFSRGESQIQTQPTVVTNGIPFTFNYRELNWKAAFVYSDSIGLGAGIWSALPAGHAGKDPVDPESGTFQAQGGPGAGDDLSASASASA